MGRESECGAPSCCGVAMPDNFSLHELNDDLNAREEPCGNIMGVMFHGCLTTAGLIGNLLERLVTHPEIQDKVAFFPLSSSFPILRHVSPNSFLSELMSDELCDFQKCSIGCK